MKKAIGLILALVVLTVCFFVVPVQAARETEVGTTTLSDNVAVSLVIDNSGSMLESDPMNNRFTAARMVLELLTDQDYLSITTFSDEAIQLVPMSQLSSEHLNAARTILDAPPFAMGNSDYRLALEQSAAELALVPDDVPRFVIFLTDGEPYLGVDATDMTNYLEAMDEQVQGFSDAGVPIYTIGFGSSDQQLLSQMSATTRGNSIGGESATVAGDFFAILQTLKNRYTVLDLDESDAFESFNITVDEYTSRVTMLLQDRDMTSQVSVINSEGEWIEPVFSQGGTTVYQLMPQADQSRSDYQVSGVINGTIKAARDTRTKLWITEPVNHAVLPLDSEIMLRIAQSGVSGENTRLDVTASQDGVDLEPEVSISKEQDYIVTLGPLPEAGPYELIAMLYLGEQIISRTSSFITLKAMPVLESPLIDEETVWLLNEDNTIEAALTFAGEAITEGSSDTSVIFELGDETQLELLDDGQGRDSAAGDGIYTAAINHPDTGFFKGALRAQGNYQGERFETDAQTKDIQIVSAGVIEVTVPATIMVDENSAEIEVRVRNRGSYPERLKIQANGELLTPDGLDSPAGQTSTYILPLDALDLDQTVTFDVEPDHAATIVRLNNREVSVVKIAAATTTTMAVVETDNAAEELAEAERAAKLQRALLLIAVVLAVLLVVILVIVWGPRRRHAAKLKGTLHYCSADGDQEHSIKLAGKKPMQFTIGPEDSTAHHIKGEIDPGFAFTISPIQSANNESFVELRCSPPGALIKEGELVTVTVLSHDDQFEMGGLSFRYDGKIRLLRSRQSSNESGQDVLSGRL